MPKLAAKPILDLLVGTDHFGDAAPFEQSLQPLGYEYAHWAGVPGHQVFGKGQPRTHLVHVVEFDGVEWCTALRFRDRLRTEPELRDAYAALKKELAAKYPNDRPRYTAEKGAFIENALA